MADITTVDTFIQCSPHPAWLATTNGHCVYANPALERLTGFNSDQVIQTDWLSFLLEEDRAVASASWQRSLTTGTPYRGQVRMRRSDGLPAHFELTAFGHRPGTGTELWLFTGLGVNDVAAQERSQLEAQLQATLNVIPAYTWYGLPSGALTFVNERNANYLGLSKDHPLRSGIDTGAEWDSHITFLHPDDREESRRVWSTCLSKGSAGEFSFRVRSVEGEYRWFLSRAEPLRANDGTLLYWIGVNLDIDDAKRTEDALGKSEKDLRDVIDTIPATVWSALPDGSNTYVNKHFVEYSGVSAEQTVGSGWQEVIHPHDLEEHVGKWKEAVASGKRHENEVRFRRSDGQYRWHLDRGVPLRNEDGHIVKWYGIVTDIEDRKRAEEALGILSSDLQESNTKLEEAQRITHVGYWEWDISTGRVNWSDETYRIYGMRPQESPIDIAAAQKKIHPEDWQRGMAEALGGDHFSAECRVFRPTGEVRVVQFQGDVKKDASGRPCHMFGTVQDITDRKRAEEALQLVSNDLRDSKAKLEEAQRIAHVGYWEWDLTLNRVAWSDETYRIYGLRPQEYPIEIPALKLMVHPEDLEFVFRVAEESVREGLRTDVEHRIIRPNGEVRTVHSVGDLKKDALGRPYQMFGTVQDVTDRNRTEDKIREQEAELRQIVDLAPQLITVFGPDRERLYANRILLDYLGISLEEWRQRPNSIEFIHPDDGERVRADTDRALSSGAPYELEFRVRKSTGSYRWFLTRFSPVRDGKGQIMRWYVAATDIEDRKRAEDVLQQSQFYLAEGQRLAHMGSWAFNPSGFFEYWSQELFNIYGLDPQQGAPTLEQYLATLHPADRVSMADTIKRMCAERSGCDVTKRIVRPDGEQRYIRCVGIPVIEGKGLKGFLGTAMDITEQELSTRELERREAYLAESQRLNHTGSLAYDARTLTATYWSKECLKIWGFNPESGPPATDDVFQRIHPEDRDRVREYAQNAIRLNKDFSHEFRIVLPDGTLRHIHSASHLLLSTSGEPIEVLGTHVDISERKRAEQEREKLRQLEADLAHTNRVSTLGEMAASLAHEIKQPIAAAITSANSCVEWLAHEPPNLDRARAAAARIDKYGNRAAEIIDRIRSFYKKSSPRRELVDVNGIIHEILTLLKGEADRCSVTMLTELAAELPNIKADRVQLQQVFMNLMVNGIEAMKDSGGDLTLKSQLQDGQLQFSVSDTGLGLPTGNVDQIFSAFFTTKAQGSGMGLAISRSIVESHGGRLWASANSGGGAIFHFTLPIQVTESSPFVA